MSLKRELVKQRFLPDAAFPIIQFTLSRTTRVNQRPQPAQPLVFQRNRAPD